MLNTAKALYDFYSSFNLPAYTTENVPDTVDLPYLVYRFVDTDWETPISHYCIIYMRTRSNEPLLSKADEIKTAIGTGLRLPCLNGCLYLHYLNAEIMSEVTSGASVEQVAEIRSVYINLQLDILHS